MKNKVIIFLQFLVVFISILMFAAHFYRAGHEILAYSVLASPLILILRKWYTARVIQVLLFIATIQWWITIDKIARMRMAFNMPFYRFTVIMSSVAIFTLLSILVFESKSMKKIYFNKKIK